jgi:hypothetical protein
MANTVGLLNNTITAENKIRIERANLILEAEGDLFRQLDPQKCSVGCGVGKKAVGIIFRISSRCLTSKFRIHV